MNRIFLRWAVVLAIIAALPWSGVGEFGAASEGVITVCPSDCVYTEIQQAIDEAPPGETVQVEPGTYEENLVITKSLTLRGATRDRVVIKGSEKGRPVILVRGEEPPTVSVRIEGLTITGGRAYCLYWPVCADGILIRGTAQVTVVNNTISDNGWGGIAVWDGAQVTIEGNLLLANRRSHIGLWGSTQATIQGNQILNNGDDGIVLRNSARATIEGNRISGNVYGIKLRDFAQATISGNSIVDNGWDGLELWNAAQAVITDNRISGNGRGGLQLRDFAWASIVRNRISDNGGDGIVLWRSAQATLANNTVSHNRNGILLGRSLEGETTPGSEVSLKLWGNEVFANRDWGVAIYTEACGFAGGSQAFGGIIQGSENRIYDNGRGDLCPPYPGPPWPEGFVKGPE